MAFLILYIVFFFIGLIICVVFGPGAVLAYGALFVFVLLVTGECSRLKTKEGRKQIKRQYEKEKKIEQYWGTIEYWEDK